MRGHSKRKSRQNWLFSDPTPPCHHLSLIRLTHPSPHVTGEIVANFENSSIEKNNKVTQCNVSTWVNEQNRLSIVLTTRIGFSIFRNSSVRIFFFEWTRLCPDFNIFTTSRTWYTNWVSLSQFWGLNLGLEFQDFGKIVS